MSNSIRSIVEDKVAAYLAANLTGVAVHKGITDDTRILPLVIAHADNAAKPNSFGAGNLGNYRVSLKVYVYSSADDETLQTHRNRVENVIALLTDNEALKTAWTGSEGSLYIIAFESDEEGMSQRRYGNCLHFTLYAVLAPQV